jgi:hypothetical protein
MTATALAILGGRHLAQIIAIAVVVLIGSGIFIWASWKHRHESEEME